MDRALTSLEVRLVSVGEQLKLPLLLSNWKKALALLNALCQKSLSFTCSIWRIGERLCMNGAISLLRGHVLLVAGIHFWAQALADSRAFCTLFSPNLKYCSSAGLLFADDVSGSNNVLFIVRRIQRYAWYRHYAFDWVNQLLLYRMLRKEKFWIQEKVWKTSYLSGRFRNMARGC